jgi:hypothetical protein
MSKKRIVLPFMLCLLVVITCAIPLTASAGTAESGGHGADAADISGAEEDDKDAANKGGTDDKAVPPDNGTGSGITKQIPDEQVPADSGTEGMSEGSLIMIIAASIIVIADVILLIMFTKKKSTET